VNRLARRGFLAAMCSAASAGALGRTPYAGVLRLRLPLYFGGLDQYRMAANSDHSQSLNPPKQSMRSDNVDFQRGELETRGHNIYFDQYSWDLKWKEVPLSYQ